MICSVQRKALCSRSSIHRLLFHTLPSAPTPTKFKSPSHQTLHSLLEKCSTMTHLLLLHAQITVRGLAGENLMAGKLISFCAVSEAGDLRYAHRLFDQIPQPNKFMYNSLIRGYTNSPEPMRAVFLYRRMLASGHLPNQFTLPFVLKACSFTWAYWEAVGVQGQALKLGLGFQVCVHNTLIGFYIACGLIGCAHQVFDEIPDRSLVSWNSMIGGYSKIGRSDDSFLLFREMRDCQVEPDVFTFVNLLSACSHTRDLKAGRFVHGFIEISGIKTDVYVDNALVDMYAKCGCLRSAQMVFYRILDKNVVSWTSMLTAYAGHGLIDMARKIFDQMPLKNVVSWNCMISSLIKEGQYRYALYLFSEMCASRAMPDEFTCVSILTACSQLGDLIMGRKTHTYIINNIKPSVTLYNSLLDMYAKCGPIETAMEIFCEMPEKNLVSWNVIITALALHGHGFKAIELFNDMQALGVHPDEITFIGLLSSCSHSGLLDAGRYYFDQMPVLYNVQHGVEHYACMVDLLGRGGLLREAVKLVGGMPMKPDLVIWGALLGACRIHSDVKTGKQVLKQVLELEPFSGGLYVLISNIYCEAQMWKDVKKIRMVMKDRGVKKCRAISTIEVEGCLHEFMVDDKRHDMSRSIYSILYQLTDHLRSVGYLNKTLSPFLDMEEI